MTTVASVWTNAQFLDGTALKGHALGLRIAAGNVPNFVDLETGGWGDAIQGPLNSSQTPTMANFATLADVLAGCVTRVTADACGKLLRGGDRTEGGRADRYADGGAVDRSRIRGTSPRDSSLCSTSSIQIPPARTCARCRIMPYLNFSPSAWVLPLKFDGGGYRAGGKAMFDSEGNLWVGDNFTVGWQGQDALWQGNATKFAPNGRPLSPITTGFTGGGMQGGTFGAAVDAKDNAWLTTYGGKSIAVFDKNGKPLTPPEGITFDGKLGLMQGVIVTPSGDVWVLGIEKNQLVYFPKGDLTKGKIVCEGDSAEPCKSFMAAVSPGHRSAGPDLGDQRGVEHVTRFPASDPSKVEKFKTGLQRQRTWHRQPGQRLGDKPVRQRDAGQAHLDRDGRELEGVGRYGGFDEYLTKTMFQQKGGPRRWQRDAASARRHAVSRARLSRAAACPVPGRRPSTATTTSGSPTSPVRTVRSWSCAASGPRTARPA